MLDALTVFTLSDNKRDNIVVTNIRIAIRNFSDQNTFLFSIYVRIKNSKNVIGIIINAENDKEETLPRETSESQTISCK